MANQLEAHDHGQQSSERLPANRMMDEVHSSRNSLNVQERHSEPKTDSLPSLEIVDRQKDASQKSESTQHRDTTHQNTDSTQHTDTTGQNTQSDTTTCGEGVGGGHSGGGHGGGKQGDGHPGGQAEGGAGRATEGTQSDQRNSRLDQSNPRAGGPNLDHTGHFQMIPLESGGTNGAGAGAGSGRAGGSTGQ